MIPAVDRDFLDSMGESLEDGFVPARVFNDAEIHAREQEAIFARAWVFVGHESEVAQPGDYCVRYIGGDAFIFVRDEHGQVRVLFNACRHRGTQVCRVERGNAAHFRCPYHGWTYDNTGALIGMPAARASAEGLDRAQWGLLEAPGVESHGGFVFATLDEDAPPLAEYLGGYAAYLDILVQVVGELEVVGSPHRWIIRGNWKSGAENLAGDDYHGIYLHRSMFNAGSSRVAVNGHMMGYHVMTPGGHTVTINTAEEGDSFRFLGFPDGLVERARPGWELADWQVDLAERARVIAGTVFPNFSWLMTAQSPSPSNVEPTAFLSVRVWQPRAPNAMELWNWNLVPRAAGAEFREASCRAAVCNFSPSGMFEQDDVEPWESIARNAGGAFARKSGFALNYEMGLTIGTSKPVQDWPGPGVAYSHRYEEGVQRTFFRRWLEFMREPDYPG